MDRNLLTGDTVYPHPVTHVIGCHIEMTRQAGVDYPVRTTNQPNEFILWPEDDE